MRKGSLAIGLLLLLSNASVRAQTVGDAHPRRVITQVDARTIADNGSGSAATLTLTPISGYVTLTCNDANGCTITMGESGMADGFELFIVNLSANPCTFADTSGVTELAGAFSMGQYENLSLRYSSSRWVEQARGTATASAVTASSTSTFTNKTLDAEGTGNVLTLPVTEYWPVITCQAGSAYGVAGWNWHTEGTDGPTSGCNGTTATVYGTANFDDSNTESIYRPFPLPSDWTGAIDLSLTWFTTATSGNVVWQVATFCLADNENADPASFSYNTAQTITDAAKASTIFLNTASLSSLTTTGCSAGELLFLKVFRNPAHASDTLGATAQLMSVSVTYRRTM
jgi:hypothetical protein